MPFELEKIEKIFREYQPVLFRVAFKIVKDEDAAKDVAQEVFINLWKNRELLDFKGSLKAYLYKSAINRSINFLERKKQTFNIENEFVHQKYAANTTENLIHGDELKVLIQNAIEKLPPKCKTIFVLSRMENMSYKEIAGHLDISIKTVENQLIIALKKLRNELIDYNNLITLLLILKINFLSAWG